MIMEEWDYKSELSVSIYFKEYDYIILKRYSGNDEYLDDFHIDEELIRSLNTTKKFVRALLNEDLYDYKYGEFVDLNSLLGCIYDSYGPEYEVDLNGWYVDQNGYGLNGEKVEYFYQQFLKYKRKKELFLKQLDLILQYTDISKIEVSIWYSNDPDLNKDYTLVINGDQISFLNEIGYKEEVYI